MSRIAIIQSSYIPWRGYFHLLKEAQIVVFLDSVQFTRQDWRTRNRIKGPNGCAWLTVPTAKQGSTSRTIAETEICRNSRWNEKHLLSIFHAYKRTKYFRDIFPHLEEIYMNPPTMLVDLNRSLINALWRLATGSDLTHVIGDEELITRTTDQNGRLIDYCKQLEANHYITGPRGLNYIDLKRFRENDIRVEIVSYDFPEYPQLWGPYEPQVSLIDPLMNVGPGCLVKITNQNPQRLSNEVTCS